MQELISITTGGQGSPVVKSARELHEFLEVKSKFSDWFKNRVNKYGFVEGVDFAPVEGFSKNLEKGGRPEIDYALSLDMAKELSMVERTPKGREARQYFIECERRTVAPTSDPLTLITQLLAEQGKRLDRLEEQGRQPAPLLPSASHRAIPSPPHATRPGYLQEAQRRELLRVVSDYCATYSCAHVEAWNYLYKRLFELERVPIWDYRQGDEPLLSVAFRMRLVEKLLTIAQNDLRPYGN